jgi:DNA-binding NarL/FixJ family response regulator
MTDGRLTGARILIVEDHDDLAEALAHNLRHEGYAAECVPDGRDALFAIRRRVPDLVVLDLNLPRLDGFGVLERLRDEGAGCPVLILSARGTPGDKVEGFRLGADDYVTKPFTVAELLGRVRALLRRTLPPSPGGAPPPGIGPSLAASLAPPAAAPRDPVGYDVIGYTDAELVARFGLTLRQAGVARLLARGLTNPEIADLLAISRFTVRNHAEQVLAKLGVTSRGRVASALRAAYDADRGSAA